MDGLPQVTNYNAFLFPCLFCFSFIFLRSNTMSTPLKVKKKHLVHRGGKRFFLLCKKAITDLLDKCVTSAGVSRLF